MNASATDLDAGTNLEKLEPDLAEGSRGQIGARNTSARSTESMRSAKAENQSRSWLEAIQPVLVRSAKRSCSQALLVEQDPPGAHSSTPTRPDKARISRKSASCTPSPPLKSPQFPEPKSSVNNAGQDDAGITEQRSIRSASLDSLNKRLPFVSQISLLSSPEFHSSFCHRLCSLALIMRG